MRQAIKVSDLSEFMLYDGVDPNFAYFTIKGVEYVFEDTLRTYMGIGEPNPNRIEIQTTKIRDVEDFSCYLKSKGIKYKIIHRNSNGFFAICDTYDSNVTGFTNVDTNSDMVYLSMLDRTNIELLNN